MQDSLGLLAITLAIILLFSILTGIIILNHEDIMEFYNTQDAINAEKLSKAKVGYYWVVEELKNKTISFIPHVYILDTEGIYNIQSILETTFSGETYTFPVKNLMIFTNGSLIKDGIILSPGDAIIIRPNITSGQISFISNTGNSFSLALLPPSSDTLLQNESNQNYTVISLGNESILSIKTILDRLLGPQNITSGELVFNSTPPLYNYTYNPSSTEFPSAEHYQVNITYFENVTPVKVFNLKDNTTYIVYLGYAWWSGKVYAFKDGNDGNCVGNFNISYNTSYVYYKYGPVNFIDNYKINFHTLSYGYVPLYMIVYTYNVTNSNLGSYSKIGNYSQLWVRPIGNNSQVYITYSGSSYIHYYYYNFSIRYVDNNSVNSIIVGGSTIYLGYFPINITIDVVDNAGIYNEISSFQILYKNVPQITNLPIIMNLTYNITSYSPPFILNISLTNASLTIMFNGTANLPNYTFYSYKLPIIIPTNESILNINGYTLPIFVPYFIIIVNGKIIGENLPP
ncbi:hypothetical protein GFS03_00680 [Sulfolobus sp. E5-1-F]|uniref:hypothetical protein n=1 Tax=Sulfolobaceae TaxID=118883 RepID=UPI001296BAEF|nr:MULTISPECIES: hypothetical protein [unclassified Sulfolobus]QGA53217.1 hypothetical protein GFS03_00680 [Sulfolobus sp. E5-1-F]QGA68335.1 hypothetical protein GFS33_05855 [Sulfolobus sp. E11-6]